MENKAIVLKKNLQDILLLQDISERLFFLCNSPLNSGSLGGLDWRLAGNQELLSSYRLWENDSPVELRWSFCDSAWEFTPYVLYFCYNFVQRVRWMTEKSDFWCENIEVKVGKAGKMYILCFLSFTLEAVATLIHLSASSHCQCCVRPLGICVGFFHGSKTLLMLDFLEQMETSSFVSANGQKVFLILTRHYVKGISKPTDGLRFLKFLNVQWWLSVAAAVAHVADALIQMTYLGVQQWNKL